MELSDWRLFKWLTDPSRPPIVYLTRADDPGHVTLRGRKITRAEFDEMVGATDPKILFIHIAVSDDGQDAPALLPAPKE